MGVKYTAWETRTVTAPGSDLGAYTTISARVRRTGQSDTIGAGPPGSYPWRNASLRLATADTARNHTTATSGTVTDAQVNYTGADFPGASVRTRSTSARVGVQSFTTADRVLIGTYYDDWTWLMWLGSWYVQVQDTWLRDAYAAPDPVDPGSHAILSYAEHDALWAPTPAGAGWDHREVDVFASGVDLAVTIGPDPTIPGSPTAPALTRRARDTAHTTQDWYQSDIVEGLASTGTITGTSTLAIGGAWSTDPAAGPRYGSTPLTGPVSDLDLWNVRGTWVPTGGSTVDGTVQEFINYSPMWPTGITPGYDETGGIPPPDPPSHVYTGGPAEDRYAYVRVELVTTFTVRQRWVGYTFGTPPLWQRQRIGVLDSPESFASGLVTPQSSPWQGGTP